MVKENKKEQKDSVSREIEKKKTDGRDEYIRSKFGSWVPEAALICSRKDATFSPANAGTRQVNSMGK